MNNNSMAVGIARSNAHCYFVLKDNFVCYDNEIIKNARFLGEYD